MSRTQRKQEKTKVKNSSKQNTNTSPGKIQNTGSGGVSVKKSALANTTNSKVEEKKDINIQVFKNLIPDDIPKPIWNFNQNNFEMKIAKRVQKWMTKRKRSSELPKTKEKFLNSIKTFCTVRVPVIDSEYVYIRLYEQNFIDVDDGTLVLVDRKFTGFPDRQKDANHWTNELHEAQVEALTKCFVWVASLDSLPNSLVAFRKSLDQLTVCRYDIDPRNILGYLVSKGIVFIDEKDNVIYK